MKTIAKINPELEYQNAKKLIELSSKQILDQDNLSSLDSSVDNLITTARVLIEREERRRGHKKPPHLNTPKGREKGETREDFRKLPSERYPDLNVEEKIVKAEHPPTCPCCHREMKESGLYDVSEKIEVIPKQYFIERIRRPKYNCSSCHGSMANTSPVPSIVPTSNYGDSLIIDVALSKFCDLNPIERYVQIAARNESSFELPPQSLIGCTHHLANLFSSTYLKIKKEILLKSIIQADESPHRMLEGDDRQSWYLWGFFTSNACYFEAHDTRSGDIAFNFLKDSQVKILLTDGYGGYKKTIKDLKEKIGLEVQEAYCNAHAFRYFEEASITWKEEAEVFLKLYKEIYDLERERKKFSKEISIEKHLEYRFKMISLFEEIKKNCEERRESVMPASLLLKAFDYFLKHYRGLTLCTTNIEVSLDNNQLEGHIRPHAVGKKTWLGTHSKRGALTAAVLFTIVETCKQCKVNPRAYVPWAVKRLLRGEEPATPHEYSLIASVETQ